MNPSELYISSEAKAAVRDFSAKLRLARAKELAQSGRLFEAEAVLTNGGQPPQNARELDLLARMATLQGRFIEAQQYWKTALQIDPGNEIFLKCLKRLTPGKKLARSIANSHETLLDILVCVTVGLTIAALIYAFRR